MKSCIGQGMGEGHKVSMLSLTDHPPRRTSCSAIWKLWEPCFCFCFFSFFKLYCISNATATRLSGEIQQGLSVQILLGLSVQKSSLLVIGLSGMRRVLGSDKNREFILSFFLF